MGKGKNTGKGENDGVHCTIKHTAVVLFKYQRGRKET